MPEQASADKEALRRELSLRWAQLWPDSGAPGRPPLFPGAGKAAERLRRQPAWRQARVVLIMADPVLLQARINALADHKTLVAATPGLKQGLVRIAPEQTPVAQRSRLLRGGSLLQAGRPLRFPQARLGRVDLLVGAVLAVDQEGRTLGDGRGLLDLTYAVLQKLGAVRADTPLAVLAAPEQIAKALPAQAWDLAADLIVTPQEILSPPQRPRPRAGLDRLPPRLAELPLVQAVRGLQGSGRQDSA